jgi:hypothetical protein
MDDRIKLITWLMEDATRCSLCGTADWEWEENQYAYIASVNVCQGCAMKDNAREMGKDIAGSTIVLLSGEAKKAELARQREAYQSSRRKGDDGG